jgi:hypothetical protein
MLSQWRSGLHRAPCSRPLYMAMRPMGRRHGLLARPMGRTARPSPCPCRHDTKASACHGPPARPMTRHGHGTPKGEARWPARLPHPAASPWQLQRRPPAGHMCCGAPPPRPILAPGAQDADAPPPCGHVAELHPAAGGARESSALSRRALHPELSTRAEQAHRRLPLTLPAGTAACCPLPPELHPWLRPEALPPALPDCHALRRRLPVLPVVRHALSTARWPMCRVVGRRLGPWHGQARHGDTTRHDAVPTRHGGHL